jgi:hypothetical protein
MLRAGVATWTFAAFWTLGLCQSGSSEHGKSRHDGNGDSCHRGLLE